MFKLEAANGHLTRLPTPTGVNCRDGAGAISPDGTQIVGHNTRFLTIVRMADGVARTIKGVPAGVRSAGGLWLSRATWSPDGRWIAVVRDGRIVLVDGERAAKVRDLGDSGEAGLSWSPDSRSLVIAKSQVRCAAALYFSTLENIDVQTGRRTVIKGSECRINHGTVGWMRCDVEPSSAEGYLNSYSPHGHVPQRGPVRRKREPARNHTGMNAGDPQTRNQYGYVEGDPINNSDPTGARHHLFAHDADGNPNGSDHGHYAYQGIQIPQ